MHFKYPFPAELLSLVAGSGVDILGYALMTVAGVVAPGLQLKQASK